MRTSQVGARFITRWLAAVVATFVIIAPATARSEVLVGILEPVDGVVVGDSVFVEATVGSTHELASVIAEVEGESADLVFASGLYEGTVSLAGVSFGPIC